MILYARTQPPRERQIAGYEPKEFHGYPPLTLILGEAAAGCGTAKRADREQGDEIEKVGGSEHRAKPRVHPHKLAEEHVPLDCNAETAENDAET